MKSILLIFMAALVLGISACGSSAPIHNSDNSQTQIRQTYHKVLTAFVHNNPSEACRYYTPQSNDKCLAGIVMYKAEGLKTSSIVPYGWENRLAKAKIVVNGDKATIVSGVATMKGGTRFARIDGLWYLDASR
jgi:hypothetical protein